jgi:hypothetical protein
MLGVFSVGRIINPVTHFRQTYPLELSKLEVEHRPVNLPAEGMLQRRRGFRRFVEAADQAADLMITVCPSRSSWAINRRVWASLLRRSCQSGPRSV